MIIVGRFSGQRFAHTQIKHFSAVQMSENLEIRFRGEEKVGSVSCLRSKYVHKCGLKGKKKSKQRQIIRSLHTY